jgi:hypothetical protein
VRRWAARGFFILVLLLPTLLPAIDHHGVERLPTHTHLIPEGTTETPPHVHGFEVLHQHEWGPLGLPGTLRLSWSSSDAQMLAQPSSVSESPSSLWLWILLVAISSAGLGLSWAIRIPLDRRPFEFLHGPLPYPPRFSPPTF